MWDIVETLLKTANADMCIWTELWLAQVMANPVWHQAIISARVYLL